MSSESEQDKLYEMVPFGVGVFDFTGDKVEIEYLNEGYYDFVNTKKEDKKTGLYELPPVFHDDEDRLMNAVKEAIEKHKIMECTFRALDGNGQYKWIALRANHVKIDDDRERFYAAYYDVNELIKLNENTPQDYDYPGKPLRLFNTVRFIYYIDRHACELLVSPNSLNNNPGIIENFPESFIVNSKMPQEDAENLRKMISKIENGEKEAQCNVRVKLSKKYTRYKVSLQLRPGKDGEPLLAVGVANDIDEYTGAQKALAEEKLRFDSIKNGYIGTFYFNVTRDICLDPGKINENLSIFDGENEITENQKQGFDIKSAFSFSAQQIPDKTQREEFLQLCSRQGFLKLYKNGKNNTVYEYRRITDKGFMWVSTRIILLQDPISGDVMAFVYTKDIENQKKIELVNSLTLKKSCEIAAIITVSEKTISFMSVQFKDDGTQFLPSIKYDYNMRTLEMIESFVVPEERENAKEKPVLKTLWQPLRRTKLIQLR